MTKLSSTFTLLAALSFSCFALQGCETTTWTTSKADSSLAKSSEAIAPMPSKALPESITRIAFGSCMSEKEDQTIWTKIAAENPDAFIFMGDNVYGMPIGVTRFFLTRLCQK